MGSCTCSVSHTHVMNQSHDILVKNNLHNPGVILPLTSYLALDVKVETSPLATVLKQDRFVGLFCDKEGGGL